MQVVEWLKNRVQNEPSLQGIELVLEEDRVVNYHLIRLTKVKDELQIKNSQKEITSFEALQASIGSDIPIVLVLSSNKLIQKEIKVLPEDPKLILSQLFPNADKSHLSYQLKTEAEAETTTVSIIKKSVLEQVLEPFIDNGLSIVKIVLGKYKVSYIENIIKESLPIKTNGGELHQIKIGDDWLDIVLLSAYSAVLARYLKDESPLYNCAIASEQQENYIFDRLIQKTLWVCLPVLFTLLLGNFLAYTWLAQENSTLSFLYRKHKDEFVVLDSLKQVYSEQEDFLKQNNTFELSKTSYYIDAIGSSIPSGIGLRLLNVFPNQAKRNATNKFDFEASTIVVSGKSKQSDILSNWHQQLKSLDWVQEVDYINYTEQTDGEGNFELKIHL